MKILVCISNVPDTTAKINFVSNNKTLDKQGVNFVINPYDEFALTRAIWFKEQNAAHITVVHVGTQEAESSLRKAIAMGADEAIRVNVVPSDGFVVAKALEKVVAKGAYDLILMGKESADYNGAMVPATLSVLLGLPFVNACTGLELNDDGLKATCEADNVHQILQVRQPAVIAGQKGLVEESDLKIPNMRGIMMARKKQIQVLDVGDLQVRTDTVAFEKPAPKGACTMFQADQIDELAAVIKNEAKMNA